MGSLLNRALGFSRLAKLLGRSLNDIPHGTRMLRRHLQQYPCRTLWRPSALLPIPQRTHTNSEQRGEFRLRESVIGAEALNIWPIDHKGTGRGRFAAENRPTFPYTCDKFIE